MKTTTQTMREGYKFFKHLRKLFILQALACLSCAAFAQNVKPYIVDLSRLPAVNDDKTATFNKATKTVTVTANKKLEWNGQRLLYLGLNYLDITGYNIARVKYKVIGDYGFHLVLDYEDDKLDWTKERTTYCPSYLNEMVIPLLQGQKKLKGICFQGTWNIDNQQFVIESVTLEKVSNPVKTDIYASDEPPVIDKATSGKIDDKVSSWDYVKNLGVGFQYFPFIAYGELDFGMDCFHAGGFKKPSKEIIHFIKEKGFKTIRLQTSPETGHLLDENYTIDPRYIKELKEVVDWIIEEDMYVIICGPFSEWLQARSDFKKRIDDKDVHYGFVDVSEENKNQTEKLIQAVWKQYAAAFNNSYDEHLIFETLNEPMHNFHDHGNQKDCKVCKKDYTILNEYNQLIVDTIRASGGNNTKRFILIEGIWAGYESITTNLFKLPKDKTKDRLIPTIHTYPMGFTLEPAKKGKTYYTEGIRKQIKKAFDTLDKSFFKKHVPVYISEVSGGPLGIPVLERINCMKDFMAEVTKNGRSCNIILHPADDYQNGTQDLDGWNIKWKEQPEYFDTIFYGAQSKEYPLSADFIKKNEVKIPSIVGKNLLAEPVEITNWDKSYRIDPELLVRSVPPKYKLEFTIEKTGENAILHPGFNDEDDKWHDLVQEKNILVKGATIQDGWCIKVTNEVFTVSIDEKLAAALDASNGIFLNGENIIIKSVKVVE